MRSNFETPAAPYPPERSGPQENLRKAIEGKISRIGDLEKEADALGRRRPEKRKNILLFKAKARGLANKLLLTSEIVAGIAGVSAGVSTAALKVSDMETRYAVAETTDDNGVRRFVHQDKETTDILDYLSGRTPLPAEDARSIELASVEKAAALAHFKLPADIETMGPEELSKIDDVIGFKNWSEEGRPKRFPLRPGTLLHMVPLRYEENETLYSTLWHIEEEAGNPQIRFSHFSNPDVPSADNPDGHDRAYYDPLTNTMYIDYPSLIAPGDRRADPMAIDDFVSEEHPLKSDLKSVVDHVEVSYEAKKMGKSPKAVYDATQYTTEGTIENEAHSEIQPELEKELGRYRAEENAKTIKPSRGTHRPPTNRK